MRDPRYKHEYLDSPKNAKFEKRSDDDDESDKHLEARDRRYSCLKSLLSRFFSKTTVCERKKFVKSNFKVHVDLTEIQIDLIHFPVF